MIISKFLDVKRSWITFFRNNNTFFLFLQADDTTAFLRAARSGNLEKVIEYLDIGLDINTANSVGHIKN